MQLGEDLQTLQKDEIKNRKALSRAKTKARKLGEIEQDVSHPR